MVTNHDKALNVKSNQPVPTDQSKCNIPGYEKFWIIDAGEAFIGEPELYEYMHQKGYRYFQKINGKEKFLIKIHNNSVDVLFWKFRKLVFSNIKKDWPLLSEGEKVAIKIGLKAIRHYLKRNKLVRLRNEELAVMEPSHSKQFLLNLDNPVQAEKGGRPCL